MPTVELQRTMKFVKWVEARGRGRGEREREGGSSHFGSGRPAVLPCGGAREWLSWPSGSSLRGPGGWTFLEAGEGLSHTQQPVQVKPLGGGGGHLHSPDPERGPPASRGRSWPAVGGRSILQP